MNDGTVGFIGSRESATYATGLQVGTTLPSHGTEREKRYLWTTVTNVLPQLRRFHTASLYGQDITYMMLYSSTRPAAVYWWRISHSNGAYMPVKKYSWFCFNLISSLLTVTW